MPKPYTMPTLYDDLIQLNISNFKEYLKSDSSQNCNGSINWSRNGIQFSSISYKLHRRVYETHIILEYDYNNKPMSYKIDIVFMPSNLGKGFIPYFICPHTNKQARKLYLISGYFVHRTAINGMYSIQAESKFYRLMKKRFGSIFLVDNLYSEMYKKHFKKFYKGKPTKRYKEILKQIKQLE
tara:strand:+ start:134 stop:679 length:546 start_codon:yes stop_codon:yes gene_type:complete